MKPEKIPARIGDLTPREFAEVVQQLLDHLRVEIFVDSTLEPMLGRPRELELRIPREAPPS